VHFSCTSDENKSFQYFSDVFPLFFLFTCVDIDSRSVSVITEKCINPAACAVTADETVIRGNSAKRVVDYNAECIQTVDNMIQSPVDNNDQYPFFAPFIWFLHPEGAVFFIAVEIEEFPVEGVMPLFELA
jgi:hypothetical protein